MTPTDWLALSAAFTLAAALSAYRSALETKRATQAQLFMQIMGQYAAPEMSEALSGLKLWKLKVENSPDQTLDEQIEVYARQKAEGRIPRDHPVDRYRRTVVQFFWNHDGAPSKTADGMVHSQKSRGYVVRAGSPRPGLLDLTYNLLFRARSGIATILIPTSPLLYQFQHTQALHGRQA